MNGIKPSRPDPDKLLEKIKEEESGSKEGKLKIFFGMCAGVGKTYAMLKAAQKAKAEGIDVVIGIVETHNRIETEELTKGLEKIPLKEINYRGTFFKEMDLDAIILRKPALVLVDELAHTNIPGSRHEKRYQDVEELLNNNINVFSTLNVQHLESRAETVQQITGTYVHETVPDSIVDKAYQVELIDLTIDELLQRLAEGKVYTPEKSKQAIQNFFRKGNLTALREMALRFTAERVDKDLRYYKIEKNIYSSWKASQRLMVAVGPSPYSSNLIAWTRRLAYSLEAQWIAVYVETNKKLSTEEKKYLEANIKLAKELGAEVITTQDTDLIAALVRVAKENNITQIIIGKTREDNLLNFFYHKSFLKKLIKNSGDIDVYVAGSEQLKAQKVNGSPIVNIQSPFSKYIISFIIVFFITIIFYLIKDSISYQTISLLFILTIALLPLFDLGAGPIFLAACLSALSWDYYFIPPQFTFNISRLEDVLMFILYFIVAIVTGLLTSKIRTQRSFLIQEEERTSSLYSLSKELSSAGSINDIADVAVKKVQQFFNAKAVIIFIDENKKLNAKPHSASSFLIDDADWLVANWVFKNSKKAGRFTNTLPLSPVTFYPLKSKSGVLGIIGIKLMEDKFLTFEQESLLDTFITQVSNAVEREYLNDLAKISLIASESEKLYKTLFDSLSHELKTPIAAIMGAVSSFKDESIYQNKNVWEKFLKEINIAADRLNRLVENLLDMARLEKGFVFLKLDWHSITDLFNSILEKLKDESKNHKIILSSSDDIPLFKFDFGLLEQALTNIIHNSLEYTEQGSIIKIEAKPVGDKCIITVSDNGKGIPQESLTKIFNKFYRIPGTKAGGTGLGLSIAKGFIEAHGGNITASNLPGSGAVFTISLPMLKDN